MQQASKPQRTTDGDRDPRTEKRMSSVDSVMVLRPQFTERLLGSGPDLALLVAPAGFSRTTCLAEWGAADHRDFACVAGRTGTSFERGDVAPSRATYSRPDPALRERRRNGHRRAG